jgi:hypothetical protein
MIFFTKLLAFVEQTKGGKVRAVKVLEKERLAVQGVYGEVISAVFGPKFNKIESVYQGHAREQAQTEKKNIVMKREQRSRRFSDVSALNTRWSVGVGVWMCLGCKGRATDHLTCTIDSFFGHISSSVSASTFHEERIADRMPR